VTAEPENYNVYGLGEVIHGLRLGNNLTRIIYAADVGDPIDDQYVNDEPATGFECDTVLGSGECHWSAEKCHPRQE
jgi:alpha-glucosidase (family GH31 glycosyl hydrolase)